MSLASLQERLNKAEKTIERERGVVLALAARGANANKLAQEAKEQAKACEEAGRLIAQFADARQAQVIKVIETIASAGLSQIFGEPIHLRIEQVTRARRIEMDIKVVTGDLETSILDARGGGLAAVAGFILRLTVLLLHKNKRKFIAADEPFAQLSEEYLIPTAEFIADICKRTDTQILMVTHQPEFAEAADRVIRVVKDGINTAKVEIEK